MQYMGKQKKTVIYHNLRVYSFDEHTDTHTQRCIHTTTACSYLSHKHWLQQGKLAPGTSTERDAEIQTSQASFGFNEIISAKRLPLSSHARSLYPISFTATNTLKQFPYCILYLLLVKVLCV